MSRRPHIPKPTEYDVLYASQFQCCICRSSRVQIHHIDFDRTNNDPNNLAVLCTPHHDEAHTTSKLTKNLTAEHIRDAKKRWESLVERARKEGVSLTDPSGWHFRCWSYHNYRLFDILHQAKIDHTQDPNYRYLRTSGIIDSNGIPIDISTPSSTKSINIYDRVGAHDASILNRYFANLTDDLIQTIRPRLIDLNWPRRAVRSLLTIGQLVYLGRRFSFRPAEDRGDRDIRILHTSANGFRILGQFDTQTVFSSSALTSHYRGTNSIAGLFHVRSIDPDPDRPKRTLVKVTPIALGTGFISLSGNTPDVALRRQDNDCAEEY